MDPTEKFYLMRFAEAFSAHETLAEAIHEARELEFDHFWILKAVKVFEELGSEEA